MQRLSAFVVSISLLLVASMPVTAQETAAGDPAISSAGIGDIPNLPAGPAGLRLLRITIRPGGAFPWNVGRQQATAGTVHEGNVSIYFEAEGIYQPYESDPFPVAPGSVVNVRATDGFFAGKETAFTILNVSSAPAVVFLGSIAPLAWAAPETTLTINFDLVDARVLGVGIIPDLRSGPFAIVIARAVYEPGQGDDVANPSGGPAIAFVEAGEFSYTLDSGTVELGPAAGSATPVAMQTVAPGSTITLHQGDWVFEQNAVTLVRNDSSAQAVAIVVVVVPAAD